MFPKKEESNRNYLRQHTWRVNITWGLSSIRTGLIRYSLGVITVYSTHKIFPFSFHVQYQSVLRIPFCCIELNSYFHSAS